VRELTLETSGGDGGVVEKGKRIALFLGAGASAPLGFPVTDQILDRIHKDLHAYASTSRKPRWCVSAHERNPRFGEELSRFVQMIFPGATAGSALNGGSIVDVLSQADHLLKEGRALSSEMDPAKLRVVRSMLNEALNGVLQGSKRPPVKRELVSWILRSARSCERTTIVSTNYDTAYELPLFEELRQERPVGHSVDMGTSFRTSDGDVFHRPQQARLALFKLHGSVNWLRCEVCRQLYINTYQRIASLEFWENLDAYNSCDCLGRLRSLMIAPSLVREMHDPHLNMIWDAALRDLRLADEWIFIGYSLPLEDIAIRTVLLQAFHSRAERPPLRVRLALWDPNETARRLKSGGRRQTRAEPRSSRKHKPTKSGGDKHELQRRADESSRIAAAVRSRYSAFFGPEILDTTVDYYPAGVEEVVTALAKEG
jgi:hypothetical protein